MKIPYCRVDCSGNELKYVKEVIESGWLTTGSKTIELENRFKEKFGSKHALAVNSCTSALHLALDSIGIKPKDKVAVPSLTFTASAEVIRYMDADPVFLDIDPKTLCITPEEVEKAIEINSDIKALIIVHFGGVSAKMDSDEKGSGIYEICSKHNVRVIEDAAHALPTKHNGNLIGSKGDITCFSFYANKTMTTGEGGMLLTSSDEISSRAKTMRLHGIDRDAWDRFTSDKASWEYDIIEAGYKYNMPDLNAAIGLAQLERLDEFHIQRSAIAKRYHHNFKSTSALYTQTHAADYEASAWHLFPIILTSDSKIGRNDLINALLERGISTSVHYKPLHRTKYYKERYKLSPVDFPNTESVWENCISLPIFPGLTAEEVDYISKHVLELTENS